MLPNIQQALFGQTALLYQITLIAETSLFLIIFYFCIKQILKQLNFDKSMLLAYTAALIFCVLPFKDEMYAWPTMASGNNFAMIMYILMLYFFLYRDENNHYLIYSLICYAFAAFTYEVGLCLPIFIALYCIITKQKWLKEFICYCCVCGIYAIFRIHQNITTGDVLGHITNYDAASNVAIRGIDYYINGGITYLTYSPAGLLNLGTLSILLLVLLDIVIVFFVYRSFDNIPTESINDSKELIKSMAVAVSLFIVLAMPFMIRDGLTAFIGETRHAYLIETAVALIILGFVIYLPLFEKIDHLKKNVFVIFLFLLLVVNQGFYANWVSCGDFQEDVNNLIQLDSEIISQSDLIYFNSSSFKDEIHDTFVQDKKNGIGIYNSQGLRHWSLSKMLQNASFSSNVVLYSSYNGVPFTGYKLLYLTDKELCYLKIVDNVTTTIDRKRVYEINSSLLHNFKSR
ncbi:hypothetical protein [Methanomicrobium mobile]|uniref:hypothetical protein n=1 Tax=Methanomicrobium mobile TaxID=2205 RepID=UPI0012F6F8ED|nr:hypothetical protein [Methanomicrobium mobile]